MIGASPVRGEIKLIMSPTGMHMLEAGLHAIAHSLRVNVLHGKSAPTGLNGSIGHQRRNEAPRAVADYGSRRRLNSDDDLALLIFL